MLEKEKKILQKEYERSQEIVRKSEFHHLFVNEKITHSHQVLDAANYLLKQENTFKNWSSKLLRLARQAALFHDIGRFYEVENMYLHPELPNNHARYGYDFLRQFPEYNNPHILLPVKHHSNMIEELYKDHEFINTEDPQKKFEVEKITFLVRDADKIANFRLLANADRNIRRLFLAELKAQPFRSPISDATLHSFLNKSPVNRADMKTTSDRILSLICWIFDLNYRSSFAYMQKYGGINRLLHALRKSNTDSELQKQIEKTVNDYLIEQNNKG